MVGIKHGREPVTGDVATAAWAVTAHTVEGVARAYKSASTQTITTATNTKVVLDAETFDSDSVFSTANSQYDPDTAGYYLVSGSVEYTNLADGDLAIAMIWVTGAEYSAGKTVIGAAKGVTAQVVDIVYLGLTDYIELYTYHDKGTNGTVNNDEDTTFLSVTPLSVS